MSGRGVWMRGFLGMAAAICCVVGSAWSPALAGPTLQARRTVLPNGLIVIALEDRLLPTVAYHTVFRAGSRNERPGITGISHLLEHMMFNGSEKFPPKAFDRLIEAGGGYANAGTGTDHTEFFQEFSSAALDTILQLEADRMRALRIDRANLEQERAIVKEERRAASDDSVEGAMAELLWAGAFHAHPYRWPIFGHMADLSAIRLEDVRAYYRTFYAPNNAVVVVVGDIRPEPLFARMRALFGGIPRRPAPPRVVNAETPQRGERRLELRRPAQLPALLVGYKVGSFRHRDDAALDVLSIILSRGESSRLYRALVAEQRVAVAAWAANDSRLDAGLFTISVQAQAGRTAAECEQALDRVLADVIANGVTEREVEAARNALRSSKAMALATNIGRARMLADAEVYRGSWRRYGDHLAARERVTPADVQRVARAYLNPARRTVVTLVPETSRSPEAHVR
ncbi:MAG TPA: pitrilysin family protein [Chthonomonadales bacterium]|nr:pitrilysin family protein [Chthonomonadales bacterium]